MRNAALCKEAQEALDIFITRCCEGRVDFNTVLDMKTLAAEARFNRHISLFERYTGVPVDEPEIIEEIARHYEKVNEAWMDQGYHSKIVDVTQIPRRILSAEDTEGL